MSSVNYQKENDIAIISLNRPDRYNAVDDSLAKGLLGALKEAGNDAEVRAILLKGEGPGFCAGADLAVFLEGVTPEFGRDYIQSTYGPIMRAFVEMPKPIIAAIHGSAAGVGCAFALACDLRIMADSASFRYAFINIGLGPDGGAGWLLTRTVGYAKAFQIAVEGEKIMADACLDLGLTHKMVPEDELLDTAKSWAHKLAQRPTLAVGITKSVLHHAMNHELHETLDFEAEQQMAAFASEDLKEGVQAFLGKREARYSGK